MNIKKQIDSDSCSSYSKSDYRTGSTFGAYINIVCVVAGTGTLGLPYALKEGGWFALVIFIISGIMAVFTSKLLIECLYCKPEWRLQEFSDIGQESFGSFGKYFVKFFQYSLALSNPCIYLLLAGLNLHQLIIYIHGFEIISIEYCILISGVIILIPFSLMKTLKEVTILAVFGSVATVMVVLLVVVIGSIQYSTLETSFPTKPIILSGIPLSFSTIVFSYGGNVVYPQVEATMRNPKAWNKAMCLSIITITVMYVIIAVCGYLFYGDSVTSPILDSLPNNIGSLIAYILITVHVLLAAPIYLCSFALEQENWLQIDRKYMSFTREFIYRIVFRSGIMIFITIVAMYVPYFSDLMNLSGAFSTTIIVFLIPVVCHYKIFGWEKLPLWHHGLAIMTIMLGIVGMILGTYSSLLVLIGHVKEGKTKSIKH